MISSFILLLLVTVVAMGYFNQFSQKFVVRAKVNPLFTVTPLQGGQESRREVTSVESNSTTIDNINAPRVDFSAVFWERKGG